MLKKLVGFAPILAVSIFAVSISAQQEMRLTYLMMGKPAGAQVSRVTPEGVREYNF